MWNLVFGYLVTINLVTFLVFGLDKRLAMAGKWRISEAKLLFLAFIGGWMGAKAAQRRFRHKTRKQPFARQLNTMLPALVVTISMGMLFFHAVSSESATSLRAFLADIGHEEQDRRHTPRFFKSANH